MHIRYDEYYRLNKIGKNPHLVSDRENLDSDCKTVNAIVNALSGSGGSMDSFQQPSTPQMQCNLKDLGRMIAMANLPRAASHGNLPLPSPKLNQNKIFSSTEMFQDRPTSPLATNRSSVENSQKLNQFGGFFSQNKEQQK